MTKPSHPELTPERLAHLAEARQQIAAEMPDLVAREQRMREAAEEATFSGELRRAIHRGDRDLISLAEVAGTTPVHLSEFLAGDRTGARELLVSAMRREAERGSMILVGDALHELVRLGEPDVAASLLELFPVELGALNSVRRTLVLAASSSDAAGIEEVAAVFERMGRALLAAETFALASTLHRSVGRARDSARCAELALAASRSCEGASVPLLAERAARISLTPRELEIAAMASSGLANRVIAARLVLSERTIESHLYRVFAKLGVTTRDQLAGQLPTVTYPK